MIHDRSRIELIEIEDVLKKYHPVWVSIHFTHPKEITPAVKPHVQSLQTPAYRLEVRLSF